MKRREPAATDRSTRLPLAAGFFLLAVSLPLGLTLEALHAFKTQAYLGSELRRELWTLAHAHGNLLGLLLIVYALASRAVVASEAKRRRLGRVMALGAVSMPVGFFLGGVQNAEGDPAIGIAIVPVGGLLLLYGLIATGLEVVGNARE